MRGAISALLADIGALNILPCVVDGTRKKAALAESVVSISDRSRRLAFVLFWAPWRGPLKPTGCKLSLALLLIDKVSSVEETSEGWRFVWISSPTSQPCISSGYGGGVSSASSNILTEAFFDFWNHCSIIPCRRIRCTRKNWSRDRFVVVGPVLIYIPAADTRGRR